MSLLRHDEIYPCDEGATTQGHALAHRMDEFRAGYSLAGYAPAEPASASPAGVHHAIPSVRRPSEMQRIENSVLTACLTQGDNPSVIAELGLDMSVFQNASQLTSWAGVCPGNNESAGKRKSSRIPKGNVYLKTALVEAANAAAKAKGTYLRDKFYRLKARRGYKRAAIAVAHKILVAIYHMLSQNVSYNDLGDLYLDKLNKHQLTRNLIRRLERLGYSVILTPQQQPA